MLVQVQQWAPLGSGYPESGRGSIPQGSAFDSRTHRFKTLIYISRDGFSGQRQSTAPVRLRKEGSRNQTTEIGTAYSGRHRNYKL